MITVQRKAIKIGNNLVGYVFILVAKYYIALEYMEEDEEELIMHLQ
jgi:hypothetical protein